MIVLFGYGLGDDGVASAYTDPVSKIRAQDESVYVNSAFTMVRNGDWLTPRFLGRLLLYKPPLLVWLSALSVKFFGASLIAVRLPALLAAAGATTLLFLWIRRSASPGSAWVVVLLLAANPLWYIFARLCYTDMLFAASVAAAMFVVRRDHGLDQFRSRCLFAICCAAGILTKNVAGLLPVVIWLLFCAFRKAPWKILLSRAIETSLYIFVLAAPWHVYQLVVHPQWFWADYVQVQLLGFGLTPPAQSSAEPQLWFYWKRIFLTDPILVAMAALALPAFWKRIRHPQLSGRADAILLACWMGVMMLALAAFGYRNLPYALNLIAPLAVLAALYGRGGSWRIALLAVVLLGRFYGHSNDPIPSAAALSSYAERGRPNELIIVAPDDEFAAATLNLPHLRYAFIDRDGVVERYARHLVYLGVTISAQQFIDFEKWRDLYTSRLHTWGVYSQEPLATAIVAQSAGEIGSLTSHRPGSDFFIPQSLLESLPAEISTTHTVVPAVNGRVFLLAKAHGVGERQQHSSE